MFRTATAATLFALCAACATATAQDTAPPGVPGDSPTIFNADAFVTVPNERGGRIQVMDATTPAHENLEIHLTILNPGLMPHAAHRHASEEIIVIRQGSLEVTLSGVTETVGPGSVLVFPANAWHGFRSVGTEPAIYTVINTTPH